MKPKSSHNPQGNLFTSTLSQIINMEHELVKLEAIFDWKSFDEYFGKLYHQTKGAPALPTRLMVGLHYLKYAFNLIDENTILQFIENPYWQYFCGYDYFQLDPPCDPSSITRWRNRIGKDGGDWKADLVSGVKYKGFLVTILERKSGFIRIGHVRHKESYLIEAEIIRILAEHRVKNIIFNTGYPQPIYFKKTLKKVTKVNLLLLIDAVYIDF